MADGGDGGLFGAGESVGWGLASKAGGTRAFRIKNLDTGKSFHVKNTPMFVDESKLTTFGSDDEEDGGNGAGGAAAGAGAGAGAAETAGPTNPGLSVTITSTEPRRDSEGRTFTAYVIKVEPEGSEVKWAVVRRYRDFFELDRMIRNGPYRRLITSVELPKKKWFGSMTQSVVQQRVQSLQRYLDWCVASLPARECAAWSTFLELNIKRTRGGFAEASKMTLKDASDVPGLVSLADAAERFPVYRA